MENELLRHRLPRLQPIWLEMYLCLLFQDSLSFPDPLLCLDPALFPDLGQLRGVLPYQCLVLWTLLPDLLLLLLLLRCFVVGRAWLLVQGAPQAAGLLRYPHGLLDASLMMPTGLVTVTIESLLVHPVC